MKGLLQSKRFRKNLGKWVFMYILCMGLFTTVVTYSKYISNMLSTDDEARVSKFNIKLRYCENEKCENGGLENYKTKKYRPSNEMDYYFAVDASNLEVNVDLYLTARIMDNHFKIKEIKEITDGNDKQTGNISKNSNDGETVSIKVSSIDRKLLKYKVTVVYNENVVDYNRSDCDENTSGCVVVSGVVKEDGINKYMFNEDKKYDVLEISYSAEQVK